jgi:uncharacterized protein
MDDLPLAQIVEVARSHGATTVRMFGSRARGTARPDSDLDLLIEAAKGTTLFDLARMEIDLEDLLGISVEVVTVNGLHPALRDEILGEAKVLAA